MKDARWMWGVAGVVLYIASAAPAGRVDMGSREELIAALERIAQGYEANARSTGPVKFEGRIFNEQKAREGREIPYSRVILPHWINFTYIRKDGKRRYEQDKYLDPGERIVALDNNKKLAIVSAHVVRLFPLTNEEFQWSLLADQYHHFVMLQGIVGGENVGRMMRFFVGQIHEGRFDRDGRELSVDSDDHGLLTVTRTIDNSAKEFVVDSGKGFNLVARREKNVNASGELWHEYNGQCEYSQLPNGAWVLSKGRYTYTVRDVTGERRLEVTDIQTQFDAPDEVFELESLEIPEDIRTVDYGVEEK